jgi:hypothetical protein
MKDSSSKPRAWKEYVVTSAELKAALGIDWPGDILTIRREYGGRGEFEITMRVRPDELQGADKERYTVNVEVPVPAVFEHPEETTTDMSSKARKRCSGLYAPSC